MIVDINFIVLDDIFSSVSKKKVTLSKISEDEISEDSQPVFISDDIRIYKKENILYIFLENHESIDNLLNILKQKDIYEDIKGIVLSYKKTFKYDINEQDLKKLIKKLVKYGDLIYLKLLKEYDKNFAKDATKVALISDELKNDKEEKKIDDNTIIGILDSGLNKLRYKAKEIGTNITNFIKN
ncbi:MAG: hypothetical protein QXW35_05825, partial [Candidatus Aenigmatarchaeota archaeon]